MIIKPHPDDPDVKLQNALLTAEHYAAMITRFVETGEVPDASLAAEDSLTAYLARTMGDADVRAAVLGSKVCERVFTDSMMQFVSLCLEKARYRLQRSEAVRRQIAEARQWSLMRRQTGWRALVDLSGMDEGNGGFDRGFFARRFGREGGYTDDTAWAQFLNAWEQRLDDDLRRQGDDFVAQRSSTHGRLMRTSLETIPRYAAEHGVGYEDFAQAWALMGGHWNTVEYERLARVARLQQRHPVLLEIANRMGRQADPQGLRRMGTDRGHDGMLPTASRSDIEGIGMGRDLGALLPSEWAQCLDPQLEDIFLKKYVTGRLQQFDSQSRQATHARSLQTKPARPKGPMIVCCDTSGSMQGEPLRLALSLMMRLSELAATQRRDCLLIAFSDRARPIDVLRDRTQLLRFFDQKAQGGTDAAPVIDLLVRTLTATPRYAGADVLWITDFRIPLPSPDRLAALELLRQTDTRLYGLQIGIAENRWAGRLDELYRIEDVRMAMA